MARTLGLCYRLFGSQGNYPTVVVDGSEEDGRDKCYALDHRRILALKIAGLREIHVCVKDHCDRKKD